MKKQYSLLGLEYTDTDDDDDDDSNETICGKLHINVSLAN